MQMRYQGFALFRLWPRAGQDPAGWMIQPCQEPMLLSRQDAGWKIEPCEQPLAFQADGRVRGGALDPDFHRLCALIHRQTFPTRYQALQALHGLLLVQ